MYAMPHTDFVPMWSLSWVWVMGSIQLHPKLLRVSVPVLLHCDTRNTTFCNDAQCTGVPTVQFDGIPATGVKVEGDAWISGFIPSNSAGTCKTSVTISDGSITLELPEAFCYLS